MPVPSPALEELALQTPTPSKCNVLSEGLGREEWDRDQGLIWNPLILRRYKIHWGPRLQVNFPSEPTLWANVAELSWKVYC